MAPTSDERREVARRLRTDVSESECIDYAVFSIIKDVLGIDGAFGAKAAGILADLIDPTCEVVGDNPYTSDYDFRCKTCGEHFSAASTPRYCPGCGRRIGHVK